MQDPNEFEKRWQQRLQAYAWVLFLIASVLALNHYSDDLLQWVNSMKME